MIKAFILTGWVTMIVFVFISGCSSQDEYKKELPPVPKDVKFTPSETSRITPVGMDGNKQNKTRAFKE
jgi:hypothetical protein